MVKHPGDSRNGHRSRQRAGDLRNHVDELELDYPCVGKPIRSMQEFEAYTSANAGSLINYSERFRSAVLDRVGTTRNDTTGSPLSESRTSLFETAALA